MNITANGREGARKWSAALGSGLLLLTLLGTAPRAEAGAVGIAPLSLEYNDALRGSKLVQTLLLSNQPSKGDSGLLSYSLEGRGEIADWITFLPLEGDKPLKSIDVPESQQAFVRVVVDVPLQSANRLYTGSVFVVGRTVTGTTKAGDVGVGTAQDVAVTVNVGGVERRESKVEDFVVDQSEVGLTQRFTAKIANSGNVGVAAQLDLVLSRAGAVVQTLSSKNDNFPVAPGVTDSVYVNWDTSEQLGGAYDAEFTVSDVSGLKPVIIGTKKVPFRLESRGTFTRSGAFVTFQLLDTPIQGAPVFAEAGFQNSGKIPTSAIVDAQVYLEDKLIKSVQSLPRVVRPGQTGRIVVSFDAVKSGAYSVRAKINYDGEVTGEKELKFVVAPNGTGPSASGSDGSSTKTGLLVAGGVGAVALLGGLAAFLRRRRLKD